jgi:transcriptional regulator with XRE-family HTH domain
MTTTNMTTTNMTTTNGITPNGNAEPTLVQRQLGRQLRQLRVRAGKTHADAETAGMGHRSTLWRIEAGRTRARPTTVRSLCWLHGADSPTTEALYAMACQAAPGWWEEYRSDLPSWFSLYVQLEAEARALHTFQPNVVDGLLQTPDYARALLAADDPRTPAADVDRQVAIRLERQRTAFDRPDPLRLELLLGEAALRCAVGGPRVLAEQRRHLLELAQRPDISVRVIPFTAGAHPGVKGGFTVLEPRDPDDPDVVYVEALNGASYRETAADLERFRALRDRLAGLSIPLEDLP